jgi:hypothetical protein
MAISLGQGQQDSCRCNIWLDSSWPRISTKSWVRSPRIRHETLVCSIIQLFFSESGPLISCRCILLFFVTIFISPGHHPSFRNRRRRYSRGRYLIVQCLRGIGARFWLEERAIELCQGMDNYHGVLSYIANSKVYISTSITVVP